MAIVAAGQPNRDFSGGKVAGSFGIYTDRIRTRANETTPCCVRGGRAKIFQRQLEI